MNISESIYIALDSVRGNKLRTLLTLLSVTIGVFAIIGAGAITRSVEGAVLDEVNSMGEGTFFIQKTPAVMMGHNWRKYQTRKDLSFKQYTELKKRLTQAEYISAVSQDRGKTVKYSGKSSDPDVSIAGIDENGLLAMGRNIIKGRNIIAEDITFNRSVAVIGNDIITKVFKSIDPIGKTITVDNHSYEIVGITNTKGAVMGQSQDNFVFVPLNSFLTYYADEYSQSLTMFVHAKNRKEYTQLFDAAINQFRIIRNLKPWEENDFEIESNTSISDTFKGFTNYLTYFGIICGIISLVAAGIGIMNIMLVSVKERTREIGVRKALGARKSWILYQFIIETITLCQIGAFMGIILGLGGAYLLTIPMSLKMAFPIDWIIFAIVICTILGIVSGAYPAWKAANLDPIEALRYE